MAGKGTQFKDNPVMNYKQFITAKDKAKSGYDKDGNISQKDADGKSNDENLAEAADSGKSPKEHAQKKGSDASMHSGWSGDTPQIKKFISKHLSTVKKKNVVDEK